MGHTASPAILTSPDEIIEGLNERQSLGLERKAILPSVPKPTMWKTSFPMSMPIEAKGVVLVLGCFSGRCGIVLADYPPRGRQPVDPVGGHATGRNHPKQGKRKN
jgi:hypothetical protein